MKRTNDKTANQAPSAAVKRGVLRGVSAVLLASLGVVLILWNQGVLPLPFFGWHAAPADPAVPTTDGLVEMTDYPAYRAAILASLFPFEQVDGGAERISDAPFDYGGMTIAYSSLSDREKAVGGKAKMNAVGGFLEILSANSSEIRLPAEDVRVASSDEARLTTDRAEDGKVLFLSASGGYLVWSWAENALIPADWDPIQSRKLSFLAPTDWFSGESGAPRLFYDAETRCYGYQNAAGEILVPAEYPVAYPYHEGCAVTIGADGRERIFDINGRELFPGRTFLAFQETGAGILGYAYRQDGILRVIESSVSDTGEESVRPVVLLRDGTSAEIPLGFEVISFSEGIFVLTNGESVGYYSANGQWIADPVYLNGSVFMEGLAVVQNTDGLYGMIDTKGKEQIPCAFSCLSPFSDGVAVLFSEEDGWQVLYKLRGIYGERGDEVPPIVTEKPFVTKVPISRNSESGREPDQIFIFPTVLPPSRTTVPEWTKSPRPTVTRPGTTQAPDPTEPSTQEPKTASETPDPTEGAS